MQLQTIELVAQWHHLGKQHRLTARDHDVLMPLLENLLGDLIHRAPNMKQLRIMPIHAGGVVNTPPERYEQNLDAIVKRLKATNAKLVYNIKLYGRYSNMQNVFLIFQVSSICCETAWLDVYERYTVIVMAYLQLSGDHDKL